MPGRYSWQDYWACVFYSGTLFTTIGYGNMACRTTYCRVATVVYSLVRFLCVKVPESVCPQIGIPIMMVVLAHWGQLMFNLAQEIWFAILRFALLRISLTNTTATESFARARAVHVMQCDD